MKEHYRETEKDHKFRVVQNKTNYQHKSQEQKYQKAFLKNMPMPKYKYPNLSDMLAIASKTLNASEKVEYKPKKNPSRNKLASLNRKEESKQKTIKKDCQPKKDSLKKS